MKRALFFGLRLNARTWLGIPFMFGGYRLGRHYMRGPGPKWHEKYDGVSLGADEHQPELPYSLWLIPAAAFALLGIAAAVALA